MVTRVRRRSKKGLVASVATLFMIILLICFSSSSAWAEEPIGSDSASKPVLQIDGIDEAGVLAATVSYTNNFVIPLHEAVLSLEVPSGLTTQDPTEVTVNDLAVGESAAFTVHFVPVDQNAVTSQADSSALSAGGKASPHTGDVLLGLMVGFAVVVLVAGLLVHRTHRRLRVDQARRGMMIFLAFVLVVSFSPYGEVAHALPASGNNSPEADVETANEPQVPEFLSLPDDSASIQVDFHNATYTLIAHASSQVVTSELQSYFDSIEGDDTDIPANLSSLLNVPSASTAIEKQSAPFVTDSTASLTDPQARWTMIEIESEEPLNEDLSPDTITLSNDFAGMTISDVDLRDAQHLVLTLEGTPSNVEENGSIVFLPGSFTNQKMVSLLSVPIEHEDAIIADMDLGDNITYDKEKGIFTIPLNAGSAELSEKSQVTAPSDSDVVFTGHPIKGAHYGIFTAQVQNAADESEAFDKLNKALTDGLEISDTNIGTITARDSDVVNEWDETALEDALKPLIAIYDTVSITRNSETSATATYHLTLKKLEAGNALPVQLQKPGTVEFAAFESQNGDTRSITADINTRGEITFNEDLEGDEIAYGLSHADYDTFNGLANGQSIKMVDQDTRDLLGPLVLSANATIKAGALQNDLGCPISYDVSFSVVDKVPEASASTERSVGLQASFSSRGVVQQDAVMRYIPSETGITRQLVAVTPASWETFRDGVGALYGKFSDAMKVASPALGVFSFLSGVIGFGMGIASDKKQESILQDISEKFSAIESKLDTLQSDITSIKDLITNSEKQKQYLQVRNDYARYRTQLSGVDFYITDMLTDLKDKAKKIGKQDAKVSDLSFAERQEIIKKGRGAYQYLNSRGYNLLQSTDELGALITGNSAVADPTLWQKYAQFSETVVNWDQESAQLVEDFVENLLASYLKAYIASVMYCQAQLIAINEGLLSEDRLIYENNIKQLQQTYLKVAETTIESEALKKRLQTDSAKHYNYVVNREFSMDQFEKYLWEQQGDAAFLPSDGKKMPQYNTNPLITKDYWNEMDHRRRSAVVNMKQYKECTSVRAELIKLGAKKRSYSAGGYGNVMPYNSHRYYWKSNLPIQYLTEKCSISVSGGGLKRKYFRAYGDLFNPDTGTISHGHRVYEYSEFYLVFPARWSFETYVDEVCRI